jgi:hypothetical protein
MTLAMTPAMKPIRMVQMIVIVQLRLQWAP